ncbi:DUF2231 domain-containing protein [Sphingomonas xanthus]|uniref:DUF2231 domain-containing protein n=1 Tax=Sphingomonas xanthus TaxID=2594473 RepID=A0A516IQ79_9SPHN|nr:DUF2231 domain-containing protein [Sphingomonas xanthus]QDP19047.1 hypothetical protein FMM02_03170 [Sphingomonas xanthus]
MILAEHRKVGAARLLQFIVLLAVVIGLVLVATPAFGHEKHKKNKAQAAQVVQPPTAPGNVATAGNQPAAAQPMSHDMMGDMEMEVDRSKLPFLERLLGWLGRLHPFVVHFPIAFFPAALFTAVVGRRRPAFSAPVQFLVVAGGLLAPFAAAAGWLAGMSADPDPILTYHRWLGVGIGIAGAGLGVWAWRRPWEDRGAGMILALSIMTLAIAVQGFLGAAVTHGMEHLMF